MNNPLHRSGATFCEFPIIFSERESGHSKFSRKILYEGIRFPLKRWGSGSAVGAGQEGPTPWSRMPAAGVLRNFS